MQEIEKINSKQSIKIIKKKTYNVLQKIFCCKLFHCCQDNDQSLMTYKDRKKMFLKLAKNYELLKEQSKQIEPFYMLMALFLGQDSQVYLTMMEKIKIDSNNVNHRNDLQFYIPQLCSYLVFHEQMNNRQLINMMEKACKINLYFSHRFYFYMKSLEVIEEQQKIQIVRQYLKRLEKILSEKWRYNVEKQIEDYQEVIRQYNSRQISTQPIIYKRIQNLNVENLYYSIYASKHQTSNLFSSSLQFVEDLICIAEALMTKQNRKEYLVDELKKINRMLPAKISIPFIQNNVRQMTVLGILFEESKIFTTKQRVPFSISLQVYFQSPKLKNSSTLLQTLKRKKSDSLQEPTNNHLCHEQFSQTQRFRPQNEQIFNRFQILNKFFELTKKGKKLLHLNQEREEDNEQTYPQLSQIFSQSSSQKLIRISKYSPFSNLTGYRIVSMIVKSNDNLKQQQFAMQLLQNFKEIFQKQKLQLEVYPYQIISTSYNSGIIEYLSDCITIDELKRKESSLQNVILGKQRIRKFVRSLAAYSLISWLLQVKDRHNGNIMINRDGSIRHIDYGFFISNSPGKGVQIQKAVPFKMSAEYVRVLGGLDSKIFQEFRKLFYQGYNAARKHQDQILILVKLMYSSYGKTMPCFQKGEQAIEELERRFNPLGVKSDIQLSLYCQNLINSSIDNWRARWYDKWQYYAQGILY